MAVTELEVRLEEYGEPVGFLRSDESGGTSYSYTKEYLARDDKVPLSLALPLRAQNYDDQQTRAFFDNLLPENDQLVQVMEREGLARTDVVGLLAHLGADCPGAISCILPHQPPVKIPGHLATDYVPLSDEALADIVRRLADREPLPNELRDPSPLAGIQRKIALTYLPNGQFGIPKKALRVPTTHILKVPRRAKGREASLEVAAAQLADSSGLNIVLPTILDINGLPALLIQRFDRSVDAQGRVRRIHQEDFAQALGLPASLKYERYGTGNRSFCASRIVELLDKTAAPALAKRDFLKSSIFNMAVGNTDNHAKNHALLYDGGVIPQLAPLYDIIPVRLDGSLTHDFSFQIGNAKKFDDLTATDLLSFIEMFGITKTSAARFLALEIAPMLQKLDIAAQSLPAQGLKDFDDLIGRESTELNALLGTGLTLRQRDYFTTRAGGWALGS